MKPAHRIEHARAEDFLASLPSESVGLIVTDPPYYRVKSLPWDRAWSKPEGFLAWLGILAAEWDRVLAPNGTLVCFAGVNPSTVPGPSMAARVECLLGERFNVVSSVTWSKHDGRGNGQHSKHDRSKLRAWAPQTERVIVCERYGSDSRALGESRYATECDKLRGFVFEPLRAYLDGERERAGLTPGEVSAAWQAHRGTRGNMVSHWFGRSQWALPTRRNYEWLRALFNGDHLRREYEDLRREYEDLRREYDHLRRPFDATAGAHHTDVWTYPTVMAKGKHPCEKPEQMAADIVASCSRPGDVVLDTFAGSGVFLRAAAAAGRVAWGCDADEWWAAKVRRDVMGAPAISAEVPAAAPVGQLRLALGGAYAR